MYWSNQTLKHKETNELIALAPLDKSSVFNRELTRAINEKGEVISININDYTHITNHLGGIEAGRPDKNGGPDLSLKKYLNIDIEKEKKKAFSIWKTRIFEQLEKGTGINCFCCNGANNHEFKEYFIKCVKAKALFNNYRNNDISKTIKNPDGSYSYDYGKQYNEEKIPLYTTKTIKLDKKEYSDTKLFIYDNKVWAIVDDDIQLSTLTAEQYLQIKNIIKL